MNHRTVRKLVGLLVAIACCLSSVVAPARAYTIPSGAVTASSLAAGATNVSYTFSFTLPSGSIESDETFSIVFPSGFDISHASQSTVTCYAFPNYPVQVDLLQVSGQRVILSTSAGFPQNSPVTVTFVNTAQITNPSIAAVYSFLVETPHDTGSGSVIIGAGGGSGGQTGAGGVTGVAVTVSQPNAGKAAEYMILFSLASDSLLFAPDDYVDIQFPTGSTLPTNIAVGTILMRNAPVTAVSVSGSRLRLWIPAALGPFSDCSVLVMQSAGILHPELPGTYVVQVATNKQVNYSSSNSYLVMGTAVINPSVVVDPARQGMAAQYQLTFTSSPSGALSAGTGRITVEFPAGTTIPASLPASGIHVNDVPALSVQAVAANKIAVTVPTAIAGGSTIRVLFGIDLGIRNPSVVGTYQLGISTSGDTTPVPVSYSVSSSQIGAVTVQVSNGAAGQVAGYTVSFTTGPGGALAAGIDRINVEFPAGTTIPASLAASSVTVNGAPSTLVTTGGMIVSVTVPASIGANTSVSLIVAQTAGVMNPVTGGTYALRVSTSRETIAVTSTGYAVSSLPVVRAAVTPGAPDGQHGYYRTKPTITLTAQSAVDAQPVISYHFDANSDGVYSGQPLTALEGTHTLTFYATDRLGNRSENGTLAIAVDSIAPIISLTSPRDGETLNSTSLVVQGSVDVGSTVQVNGQNATVDATGAFAAPVTIQGTSATLVVEATDVAGNTARRTVSVSVDKTPPTLTVSQPVNFQKIQRLPIVVMGRTEVGAAVTVQGAAGMVLADGSFEYSIASASDGPLTIAVVARDAAGNTTTRSVVVSVLSTKLIQMQVGAKAALVNGQSISLQTAPVIRNGATLVPLRFVAETFGISPIWDGVFQIIDLPLGTRTVRLQIGQRFAAVDGKRVSLDAAPVIVNGVTMVPLRFIADTLGADTQWEAATRTIIIVYPRAS
ncbi:MAG: stalk domain-containing protein [Caldiserica bacterium]|nr:stalk domain-containing protein [Caldisericota bacterium]